MCRPFITITAQQVRDGLYRPRQAEALPRVLAYLDELENRGRYTLMIWPVHCEIGTWGHNVHADVMAACNRLGGGKLVCCPADLPKGANPWTEHYSAMQAEVPDAEDPDTQLNRALIARSWTWADVLADCGRSQQPLRQGHHRGTSSWDNLPSGKVGQDRLAHRLHEPGWRLRATSRKPSSLRCETEASAWPPAWKSCLGYRPTRDSRLTRTRKNTMRSESSPVSLRPISTNSPCGRPCSTGTRRRMPSTPLCAAMSRPFPSQSSLTK
jgi:hypothetical protein